MNNAEYGISFQKRICQYYDVYIHSLAKEQFDSNSNEQFNEEIDSMIPVIFNKINSNPKKLLTYSRIIDNSKVIVSPHNFLLEDERTLSIRTNKKGDKVAPRVVGQAGYNVLNEYFAEIYGKQILNQDDIKELVYEHIHKILPIFINKLFQSDVTVFVNQGDSENIKIIYANEVGNYSFSRKELSFTKSKEDWKESITLKYGNVSIAEIQVHKNRTFKFRFIISKIPEWFKQVKMNNETLGMSAEAAICDVFDLEKPASFATRASKYIEEMLFPTINDAFTYIPKPIMHSGSMPGERGEQSKCSYDFVLEGQLTLSLKTNKGKMVCPPEVGQPGSKTCLLYFNKFFEKDIEDVTRDAFKRMVYDNIEKIMPIYVSHLFDSDWLLWIYETKNGYEYKAISGDSIEEFNWEREKFSYTKPTIEEWNESNTVKYDGLSIGEFQVHTNRNCFKFRFNLMNLLKLLNKDK